MFCRVLSCSCSVLSCSDVSCCVLSCWSRAREAGDSGIIGTTWDLAAAVCRVCSVVFVEGAGGGVLRDHRDNLGSGGRGMQGGCGREVCS